MNYACCCSCYFHITRHAPTFCSTYRSVRNLRGPMRVTLPFTMYLLYARPSTHVLFIVFVVQSLSRVQLFETACTTARQAFLSFTISWSCLKLISNESVMSSSHLIHCLPPLLLPSIFPSIRVFSNELAVCFRWPKYWRLSISPSNEDSGLISFTID